MQPVGPPLLDRVRHAIRAKHYSLRTEQTYIEWIKRYVLHHGKRHPSELGAAGIEAFLTHTAVEGRVAVCARPQVGEREPRVGLAIRLSRTSRLP